MLLALLLAIAAPPKGQWATDETGKVSAQSLDAFNTIAQALDQGGLAQLGLAVVKTTHGENPRQFATGVFNAWGVGHAGKNDGVLLFFALDDRKSEIVLGDGYTPATKASTDSIMREQVVANMKAGRLDNAVLEAAAALVQLVATAATGAPPQPFVPPPSIEPPIKEHSPRGWTIDLDHPLTKEETAMLDREGDAVYAAGKGMLFVAVYEADIDMSRFASRLRNQLDRRDLWIVFCPLYGSGVSISAPDEVFVSADYHRAIRDIEYRGRGRRGDIATIARVAMHDTAMVILHGPPPRPLSDIIYQHRVGAMGGAGGIGLVGLISLRSWLRRRPRRCEGCSELRHRLSEETDDPHLDSGQKLEESLGSVDYDVWWCGRCNDALVLRYGAFFTSYSTCSGCSYKTMSSNSVTLVSATYDHGGTVQVTETCRNCPHSRTYKRYTSKLTRPSSSSSYSSSSRSSWSSSSSSRSSSSSSSSFGGGRSSGGGSSGSW